MDTTSININMEEANFQRLLEMDSSRECFMLNMLRFRDLAEYQPQDPEFSKQQVSGREAFYRYVLENRPYSAAGGRVFEGDPVAMLISPPEERWDVIFIRHYYTLQSFIDMIRKPEYLHASRHRRAAVADSRLIVNFAGTFTDGLTAYAS